MVNFVSGDQNNAVVRVGSIQQFSRTRYKYLVSVAKEVHPCGSFLLPERIPGLSSVLMAVESTLFTALTGPFLLPEQVPGLTSVLMAVESRLFSDLAGSTLCTLLTPG